MICKQLFYRFVILESQEKTFFVSYVQGWKTALQINAWLIQKKLALDGSFLYPSTQQPKQKEQYVNLAVVVFLYGIENAL